MQLYHREGAGGRGKGARKKNKPSGDGLFFLERVMGLSAHFAAWLGSALPARALHSLPGAGKGVTGAFSYPPFESPQFQFQQKYPPFGRIFLLERVMGLEPTISAWKANVLPLHYTRVLSCKWCGRRDLNSYAFRHWNLNPARLPIPPRPQAYYSNLVTRRRFELRTP